MHRPQLNIDHLLHNAVECYNRGQLLQAKKICGNILAILPDSPDTFNLLGLIAYEQRDLDTAIALITRAVRIAPDRPIYYRNLGNAYKDKGLHPQAMACFRRVVKLDPDNPEAYFKLGAIENESGNEETAVDWYNRALDLNPSMAEAWYNLGLIMVSRQNITEAIRCFQKAIQIYPDFMEAIYQLGKIYKQQRKIHPAKANFHRVLELKPDMPDALFNLALVHADSGECDTAVQYYQRVLKIAPDSAETLYNLANLIAKDDRFDDAIRLLKKALRIRPDHADSYNNLGLNLKALGKLDEAIRQYRKAIEINPALAHIHLNLALALLLAGKFSEGWREYDWRFEVDCYKSDYRYRDRKIWDGKPFKDKRLLIHEDQGLGDTLQFIRYLPLVKELGGTVIFEARREIITLIDEFPGIDTLVECPPEGASNVKFDYYIPLLSIPGRLGTKPGSIPANIPYLFGEAEKCAFWKEKMKRPVMKIGLIWAGNKSHVNDRSRSCSLDRFNWLQNIPNISVFSLQKAVSAQEEIELNKLGAGNLGPQFKDFSDTAAAIENLDLVIAVDTAVAHLAGAMGKPTWILLHFDPDWRWLLERTDSPWYPTVRLFRQRKPGDWDGVMSTVCRALKEHVQLFGERTG